MLESDVIHMRGLEFYAYHGVLPEEELLGQKFIIDVDLYLNLTDAGRSDQVEDTISYAEVYQTVKRCVVGKRFSLLEGLAEAIATDILAEFPCAAVRLEVHKPQAPIPAVFRDVSVEIRRERR